MRRRKIIALSLAIITSSFATIINTSALSYQSNIGIGFTFNPTLSVSISPSDLIIDNLIPGNTLDSNSINVSVTTNAAYGYTLSANVNDENLVHSNSNNDSNANTNNSIGNNLSSNVFSSIATNANLASLDDSEDTNIWGYSYKNNTAELSAWSNYNGLSSSSNAILSDNSNAADSTGGIDFKIAAKAGNTQPSGEYTGTINFYATTKPTPITLSEAYASEGKTMINGYYTMQDMTSTICEKTEAIGAQLQVLDIRDNKLYWVSKLADNHCWMTQNLDLDLSHEVALTSETSDIDPESYSKTIYTTETGYSKDKNVGIVSWLPERSTYTSTSAPGAANWAGDTGDDATSGYYHPYSYNRIDNDGGPVYPDSIMTKTIAGGHAQSGNYYNWSAAVASNNSLGATGSQNNSICPNGWRMPTNGEYGSLYGAYKTESHNDKAFGLMDFPLYFIRSGNIQESGSLRLSGEYGFYWSSTLSNSTLAYFLYFNHNGTVIPAVGSTRYYSLASGFSLRCLAR